MSRMIELLERFELPDGFSDSRLPGVRLFQTERRIPRTPLIYDPVICVLAQGTKVGYLGEESFTYDKDNYLVVCVAMPFECEVFASPEKPVMGIQVNIDLSLLYELIPRLGPDTNSPPSGQGIGPAPLEENMADALVRLLECLQSDTEAEILGPGLIREIHFRALQGARAPLLHALTSHNGNFARIARALQSIHEDYAAKLNIDQLARRANMSPSAFHRAFREVTSSSPMQYLKKFRLNRAREFMERDNMKAYAAADLVGYESASQFSREFKRYFGLSPADAVREVRGA